MTLTIEDQAPEFMLQDQNDDTVSLLDLRGKWVVLYFYPEDGSPGCTQEAIDFSVAKENFALKNAIIVGISPDSWKNHYKFVAENNLDLTLLSDEAEKVINAYNVTGRTTFLINPAGKILYIWKNVKVKGHVHAVLKKLNEVY